MTIQNNNSQCWEPGGTEFIYAYPKSDPDLKIDLSEISRWNRSALDAIRRKVLSRLDKAWNLVSFKIIDADHKNHATEHANIVKRYTLNIKFSTGGLAKAIYLHGRPRSNPDSKKIDIVTQKFIRTCSNDANNRKHDTISALFGPRGRPHGKNHVVLGNQNLNQELTSEAAELFISVLIVLGDSYEGFFNGPTAASHPNILHCHYWQEKLPVLKIKSPKEWPIELLFSEHRSLIQAAEWMVATANQLLSRGKDSDFVFGFNGELFRCLAIPRFPMKKKPIRTLANGSEDAYDKDFSTFGILEMSGYLVGISTEHGFEIIKANPNLYEECLIELTI